MAQPTPYTRQYNFTNYQSLNPTDPLPADEVDAELNAVKTTLDETLTNIALIQRDDGEIANQTIGAEQLKDSLKLGFDPAADWATETGYTADLSVVWVGSKIYRCETTHTSGVFADDLAAGYWSLIADFSVYVDAAAASALEAAGYASSASDDADQTVLDRVATALDRIATAEYVVSAEAAAAAAAASASQAIYKNIVTLTNADSPYAPALSEEGTLYRIDTSGGDVVINLSALSVYAEDIKFAFCKVTADANKGTINRGGTDTIQGDTSFDLTEQWQINLLLGGYDTGTWLRDIHSASIEDGTVTLAKLQDIVTDTLLGRSTAGTGVPETIPCTAAGRALLDDADAAAQRTTLGAAASTTTVSAAGIATGGGDLSANRTITVSAASQADMEAASSSSVAVTPNAVKWHPGVAKAWCAYTMTTTTAILGSYNISSLTDGGTGITTIYFASAFSNVNYSSVFGGADGYWGNSHYFRDFAVGSIGLTTLDNSGERNTDLSRACIAMFGDF